MFSTPKKRLEFFAFVLYEGKKSLLQKAIEGVLNIKFTRQNFYNQITADTVNSTLLNGLHKLGLNINWYLDGSGLMFNDNDVGKALKEKFKDVLGIKYLSSEAHIEQLTEENRELRLRLGTQFEGNMLTQKVAAGKRFPKPKQAENNE